MKRLICKLFGHNWPDLIQKLKVVRGSKGRRQRVVFVTTCTRCGEYKELSPLEQAEW